MKILLIVPTIFFLVNCATRPAGCLDADAEAVLSAIAPAIPAMPQIEPVRFEARDGGLWLSHDDYRALERNIIAMREYAARLEAVLEFWAGEGNDVR